MQVQYMDKKYAKKLLKMDYITNTSHNSKIFCKDEDEFLNVLYRLKRFVK